MAVTQKVKARLIIMGTSGQVKDILLQFVNNYDYEALWQNRCNFQKFVSYIMYMFETHVIGRYSNTTILV
jgi:hypothetical protein